MKQKYFIAMLFIGIFFCLSVFQAAAHGLVGGMHMEDGQYNPTSAKIFLEEKLTFKNDSKEDYWPEVSFQATPKYAAESFSSPQPIKPGQLWVYKFMYAGTWHYKDKLHPAITGTIDVTVGSGVSHVAAHEEKTSPQEMNLWSIITNFLHLQKNTD